MPNQKFVMPPEVVKQMEEVVANGVSKFLVEFNPRLFPKPLTPQSADAICAGLALGIRSYAEQAHPALKTSFLRTLALNLLDSEQEPK